MSFWSSVRAFLRAPKTKVREVDAAEARRLQQAGALVIDVREKGEWKRGHLPGALHIPLGEVEARASEIPTDRPVVVHCAMGGRSRRAAAILQAKGVENVANLDGGIHAWERAGLPTEKEP